MELYYQSGRYIRVLVAVVCFMNVGYAVSAAAGVDKPEAHKRTISHPPNIIDMASAVNGECRQTMYGAEYRGRRFTTISGRTCQRWDSQYPHEHTRNNQDQFPDAVYNEDNYCRNPDHESGSGPWCYTTDPDVRWEVCGIPMCPECKTTPLGVEFRGEQSTTASGLTCQRWDSQYPHEHTRDNVWDYPDAIHNKENYCRNPDHEETGPWCYTTSASVRWETCGIPSCTECRSSYLGTDYRGERHVTISGRLCQRWDSQFPHEHIRNNVWDYPHASYNEENYCRNPDDSTGVGPWCYTTDPNVRWESCGIPICPGP